MSPEERERLSRTIAELEARLARLDREAGDIRGELRSLQAQVDRAPRTISEPAPPPVVVPAPVPVIAPAPAPTVAPTPAAAPTPTSAAAPTPAIAPTPTRQQRPAAPATPSSTGGGALEEQVALVWFARIGALVLLCGVGYLYSYAVERNWISPLARCLLGVLVGGGLVAGAELLRRSTHALYVQVLLGLGVAFLYLSDYAAYGFYSILTAAAALRLAALISVAGGLLAVRHRSEAVFVFSLIGGFLAPALLSTGEDRPVALFGYVLVLSGSSLTVSLRQRFQIAVWVAIAGAQLLLLGWYLRFYDAHGAYAQLGSRWAPLVAVAALLAEWLLLYRRGRDVFAAPMPLAIALVALLFGHLGSFALLFDLPVATAFACLLLAGVGCLLLAAAGREDLLPVPLAVAWLGLGNLAPGPRFALPLVLGLAWAGVYFAAASRDLVARRAAALPALRLLGASLPGLAAVQLTLDHTAAGDAWLRAALVAAVAVADGAIGLVLRRGANNRGGNVLWGQALGLVALAAQLALAGSALVVTWALLATVVLWLAAHERDEDWLVFGVLLWILTLVRCVFGVIAAAPKTPVELDLCACAVGLFVSWWALRRNGDPGFQRYAPWLLGIGHGLLLWAILTRLALVSPSLPDTLVLAAYATALVGGGFWLRERHHRYLGLALFAITIGKLVLWDVFHHDVLFRVLVLIGVGILLLGASFLYARYGRRLFALVRDGELDRADQASNAT